MQRLLCPVITRIAHKGCAALEVDMPRKPLLSWSQRSPLQQIFATWHKPLEPVSIRVMYSAALSCLPTRAANFLLLGYTNCRISILHWAAAGSWGPIRHRWPLQAFVITDRLCTFCLSSNLWSCGFNWFHFPVCHNRWHMCYFLLTLSCVVPDVPPAPSDHAYKTLPS